MIYEAPEILAIAEQRERLHNAVTAISKIIPEDYMSWRSHGYYESKLYTAIMIEVFKAKGLQPTEEMFRIVSED